MQSGDGAIRAGAKPHFHLHGFDADERLARLDRVAHSHRNGADGACHGRAQFARVEGLLGLRERRFFCKDKHRSAQSQRYLAALQQAQGLPLDATLAVEQAVVFQGNVLKVECLAARQLHAYLPAVGADAYVLAFGRALQAQRGAPGGHAVRAERTGSLCHQRSGGQGPGIGIGQRCLQQGNAVLHPLVDGGGVHARCTKVGVVQQVAQEPCVVAHAEQRAVFQRSHQAADGVIAVAAVCNQLGHHGVVPGGDGAAFLDASVDADFAKSALPSGAACQRPFRAPELHRAGLWCKAVVRVFGVDPHFNGVAVEANVLLLQRQGFARCHAQLPLHQIEAGHAFGHRVLHLQAGVHFQEVVAVFAVHDELHRARAPVAHSQCGGHGIVPHLRAHLWRDDGGGRFFNHFLAPALRRAVALAQVHGVPVGVGKHLDFNVAATFDQAFEHQRAVAKGAGGFAPGAFNTGLQFTVQAYQAHAAPAAACHSFDQQGVAELPGLCDQRGIALVLAQIARSAGHTGFHHALLGQGFVAHGFNGRGRRADEQHPCVRTCLRKGGVLAQKAVARVQGIGTRGAAGVEQGA